MDRRAHLTMGRSYIQSGVIAPSAWETVRLFTSPTISNSTNPAQSPRVLP
jgi:hypothetical protein